MIEVRLEVGIDTSQKIDSSGNKIVLIQSRFSPISGPEGDRYVMRRTAGTNHDNRHRMCICRGSVLAKLT